MIRLFILFLGLWIVLSKNYLFLKDDFKGHNNMDKVATVCGIIFIIVVDGFCWYWLFKLIGL